MKKGVVLSIASAVVSITGIVLGLVENHVNKEAKKSWEAEQIDKSVAKYLSKNSLEPKTEV